MKLQIIELVVLTTAIIMEIWTIASGNFNPVWDIPLLFLVAYILAKKYKAYRNEKKK